MNWLEKLKNRWGLGSLWQVIVVLVVFACTGFTVLFLRRPLMSWIGTTGEMSILYSIAYYIFILPVYNVILLIYGFIFGQFHFFWEFEKKMWRRMTGKKSNETPE